MHLKNWKCKDSFTVTENRFYMIWFCIYFNGSNPFFCFLECNSRLTNFLFLIVCQEIKHYIIWLYWYLVFFMFKMFFYIKCVLIYYYWFIIYYYTWLLIKFIFFWVIFFDLVIILFRANVLYFLSLGYCVVCADDVVTLILF